MKVSTAATRVIRAEEAVAAAVADITTTKAEEEATTPMRECTMSLSSSTGLVVRAVVELLILRMHLRRMRRLDPKMLDDLVRITVVEDVVVVETRGDIILIRDRWRRERVLKYRKKLNLSKSMNKIKIND